MKARNVMISGSLKSKDANFSSLNRLAPLSEKTQISETRFNNHFLQGRNFQTQEVHNKDIWTHFVVHHLIPEKQILVF